MAVLAVAQTDLLDFSIKEWNHERAFHIEDAYKWLFHATLGGEHAVTSEEGPRAWLDDEWKTLAMPHKDEPLVVSLRPDGALVRLNLRLYKARGGDKESLLKAFIAAAKEFKSDRAIFKSGWLALGTKLKRRPLGLLTAKGWLRLHKATRAHGYPAIEHSPAYEKANRPAYRVLTKERAASLTARLHR